MQNSREVVAAVCERALDAAPASVREAPTGHSKHTALVVLEDGREVVVQYRGRWPPRPPSHAPSPPEPTCPSCPSSGPGRSRSRPSPTSSPGASPATTSTSGSPHSTPPTASASHGRSGATSRRSTRCSRSRPPGRWRRDPTAGQSSPSPSRRAFYREYLDRALADWPPSLRDLEPPVEAALGDRLDDLPADETRLFPWDYRPGNVVVRGDPPAVAAVLDWGEPLAAHPGLSAAKAEFTLCDWYVRSEADVAALREAYRTGYSEVRPFPDEALDAFRLLGMADSAADSRGDVTRPRYPVIDGKEAVTFQRERIGAVLERVA